MKSVDLRRTLELLAVDESASPTEREHARRLLDRMYSDVEIAITDDEVGEEASMCGSAGKWIKPRSLWRIRELVFPKSIWTGYLSVFTG